MAIYIRCRECGERLEVLKGETIDDALEGHDHE